MYSIEELSFIAYNNRSMDGVVKNFIPHDIDIEKLLKIESILSHLRKVFYEQKFIEIERSDLNENANDIIIYPQDIKNLKEKILNSRLNNIELNYLVNRGIKKDTIEKWNLSGLSSISDYQDLIILNATCHPVLNKIIEDGVEGGGIIIPLFKNGELINCAIRKISDIGKLKYSLACPDIDVWGIEDIENEEIYITEGLFDMMALRSIGFKSASVSSAMWSGIQLYKLIQNNPKFINIFCDNDSVGLKTGFILHKFFNIIGINNKTIVSEKFKDASEHIFQNKMNMDTIVDININLSMIDESTNDFNLGSYLKNRKFN